MPETGRKMMEAVTVMHAGAQAFCFAVALIAFIVAAVIAYREKATWATFVAIGLAFWVFVSFWNALALS